jgi:hypothetical protein
VIFYEFSCFFCNKQLLIGCFFLLFAVFTKLFDNLRRCLTKYFEIMIIGLPKEIKNNENRVALTPAGVKELVERGHTVYVQMSAGAGSGFSDDEYAAAGACMLSAAEDVYAKAEMTCEDACKEDECGSKADSKNLDFAKGKSCGAYQRNDEHSLKECLLRKYINKPIHESI